MRECDAAIGQASDGGRVRDHENSMSFAVQFVEELDHGLLVGFIQVSGRLVGENELRMIDQRPGNSNTLLFAPGKFSRQMLDAIAQAYTLERFPRLFLIGAAVKILRQHYVF